MKILYKYKPFNDFTIKLMENSELYFPFPKEFNDPFDCSSNISYAGTEEQHLNFMKSSSVPDDKINTYMQLLKKYNYDPTDIIDNFKSFRTNDYLDSHIVYSLTSIRDNTLMWSHYSHYHQGVCIGFETTEIGTDLYLEFEEQVNPIEQPYDKLGSIWKVKYNKNMPKVVKRFEPNQDYFSFFITKHSDWKYENEYRLILLYHDFKKQIYKFKKNILKVIIFGMRMSEDHKKTIKEIVNKNYISQGFRVDFYQARSRKGTYLLDIIKE